MVDIKAFHGIRYNANQVDQLANTISLPYDKISPEQFQSYIQSSPYNVARVILGEKKADDHENNNCYTRAHDYMEQWLKEGVLKVDEQPALYVYEQEFKDPSSAQGQVYRRTALMSLLRLEEFEKGIVLPHERTLSGPKVDRLNLMHATGMNFGKIFGLYKDQRNQVRPVLSKVKQSQPLLDITTNEEGVRHRLWALTDTSVIESVIKEFKDKKVYIADGHHRYSTGIIYRDELRKQLGEDPSADYNFILMALVAIEDEGLVVLPTHRVVHSVDQFQEQKLLDQLKNYFDVKEFKAADKDQFLASLAEGQQAIKIGYATKAEGPYYELTLQNNAAVEKVLGSKPNCLRSLDVTILHDIILQHILGFSLEDVAEQKYLGYIRGAEKALDQLSKKAQAVFLLNPTRVEQVLAVADQSEIMPQKSTDFYPKLYTGTVMAKIYSK